MQSKYLISLLYLNILETCLNQCSIQSISCRSYILAVINGITDKQKPTGKNHLITEFKQNSIMLVCYKSCASRSVCIRTRQMVEWIRPNNNKTQNILLPVALTILRLGLRLFGLCSLFAERNPIVRQKKNTATQLYVTSTSYRLLTGANRTTACRFQFRQSATK